MAGVEAVAKKKPYSQIKSDVAKKQEEARTLSGKNAKGAFVVSCGDCLNVRIVKGSGRADYICRTDGKTIRLGEFSRMRLETAFAQVKKIKAEQVEKKEKAKQCPTVEEFFPHWLEEKKENLKDGSGRIANFKSLYKQTLAKTNLLKVQLSEITRLNFVKELRATGQTEGNIFNTATMMETLLTNALNQGLIVANPLSGITRGSESPFKKPKAKNLKSIKADEFLTNIIPALMKVTKSNGGLLCRCFYLMLILTAYRFSECRLMRWSWINHDINAIVIPPDARQANKTRSENHIKPITPEIQNLLDFIKSMRLPPSDFVFQSPASITPKTISENSLREPFKAARILAGTDLNLDYRRVFQHGIRSMAKTFILEKTGDPVAAEMALTHEALTKIEKTYDLTNYTERVRDVLKIWTAYVMKSLPEGFLMSNNL